MLTSSVFSTFTLYSIPFKMQVLGQAADEGGACSTDGDSGGSESDGNGDGDSGGSDDDSGSGVDEVQDCPDGQELRRRMRQ